MRWGNKDKIRFVPIEEVKSGKDYTLLDKIDQLGWYTLNPHKELRRRHSVVNAVKKSTETKIETQTLYFTDLDSGRCGFVQLLFSSVVGGIYKGFQLNFKSFRSRSSGRKEDDMQTDIWESFKLDHIKEFSLLKVISPEVTFAFKNISGDSDLISKLEITVDVPKQSSTTELNIKLVVDIYSGFIVNPDGCSYYLDKPLSNENLAKRRDAIYSKKLIRHVFVPRVYCRGTISYCNSQGEKINFQLDNAPGLYIDAVQGLAPHRASNRWNFCCFQSATTSLLCMEFTTPEEYDSSTVSVWCATKNDKIEIVGSSVNGERAQFVNTSKDTENGYHYPTHIKFPLGFEERNLILVNRYDIMGELPSIVKTVAENLAHIKPYIYQYCQDSIYNGENGISVVECTFISS